VALERTKAYFKVSMVSIINPLKLNGKYTYHLKVILNRNRLRDLIFTIGQEKENFKVILLTRGKIDDISF
jgi:hypothetical protein